MKQVLGILAGALLGLTALASPASAVVLVEGTPNDLFFVDHEKLYDAAGNIKAFGATPEVGDHLVLIVNTQNIDTASGTHFFQGPTSQLSGYGVQRIDAILTHDGITHFQLGTATNLTFKDVDGSTYNVDLSPNEMFRFYLQEGAGTTVYTSGTATLKQGIDIAGDGSLLFSVGLTGNPANYSYSHPILGPNPEGLAWGGLDVMQNNTGFLFAPGDDPNEVEFNLPNQFVFSSEFEVNPFALTGQSPWDFRSNDPARVNPAVIPEASSLWMLGMGLSGLGVFRRRKIGA